MYIYTTVHNVGSHVLNVLAKTITVSGTSTTKNFAASNEGFNTLLELAEANFKQQFTSTHLVMKRIKGIHQESKVRKGRVVGRRGGVVGGHDFFLVINLNLNLIT